MNATDDQSLRSNIPADALYESWESLEQKSLKLGSIITEHCKKTGEGFDRMVVVPRGGYYPANILARELDFTSRELLHACLGSYKTSSITRETEMEIGQMPLPYEVAGMRLLIIEEVCDTGHVLSFLYDFLEKAGAKSIRSAVLHYKPINSKTHFKPDWWITETDKWIVYPYEVNEQRGKVPLPDKNKQLTRLWWLCQEPCATIGTL